MTGLAPICRMRHCRRSVYREGLCEEHAAFAETGWRDAAGVMHWPAGHPFEEAARILEEFTPYVSPPKPVTVSPPKPVTVKVETPCRVKGCTQPQGSGIDENGFGICRTHLDAFYDASGPGVEAQRAPEPVKVEGQSERRLARLEARNRLAREILDGRRDDMLGELLAARERIAELEERLSICQPVAAHLHATAHDLTRAEAVIARVRDFAAIVDRPRCRVWQPPEVASRLRALLDEGVSDELGRGGVEDDDC